jgi:hypothetical protein
MEGGAGTKAGQTEMSWDLPDEGRGELWYRPAAHMTGECAGDGRNCELVGSAGIDNDTALTEPTDGTLGWPSSRDGGALSGCDCADCREGTGCKASLGPCDCNTPDQVPPEFTVCSHGESCQTCARRDLTDRRVGDPPVRVPNFGTSLQQALAFMTQKYPKAEIGCRAVADRWCCIDIWCEPVALGQRHCAVFVEDCEGGFTSFELRRIKRQIIGTILEVQGSDGADSRDPAYLVQDNVPLNARGEPKNQGPNGWAYHDGFCMWCSGCLDSCLLPAMLIEDYPHLGENYNPLKGPNSNTFASWYATQAGYSGPAPANAPGW